jgi:glycosyltransferase involved in cell wall biosynthesis
MPKIAVLNFDPREKRLFPPDNGYFAHIYHKYTYLVKNDPSFEVTVFSLGRINERIKYSHITEIRSKTQYLRQVTERSNFALDKIYFTLNNLMIYIKALRGNDIEYLIKEFEPDVLVLESGMIGIDLTVRLKDSLKVPLVSSLHNDNYEFLITNLLKISEFLAKIAVSVGFFKHFRKQENKLLFRSDLIAFVSHRDKKLVDHRHQLSKYHKKMIVTPNGTPKGRKKVKLNRIKNTIGFIGPSIIPHNQIGLEWFIKHVFNDKFFEKYPHIKMIVAGRGWDKKDFKHPNIHAIGFVDRIEDYFDQIAVNIAPIFSSGGVNFKVIESLGHGTPVITTPRGVEGLKFDNSGFVDIVEEPIDFVRSILKFASGEIKRDKFDEIQDSIHHYYWDTISRDFSKDLLELLN